ncbi:MAG: hypothetical protein AAF773_19780 [Cyanobacteria bacterium P01_D01_bin.115]
MATIDRGRQRAAMQWRPGERELPPQEQTLAAIAGPPAVHGKVIATIQMNTYVVNNALNSHLRIKPVL